MSLTADQVLLGLVSGACAAGFAVQGWILREIIALKVSVAKLAQQMADLPCKTPGDDTCQKPIPAGPQSRPALP